MTKNKVANSVKICILEGGVVEKIAKILRIDEGEIERRRSYLDITPRDVELLREANERLSDRELDRVFTEFYRHLEDFEHLRSILHKEPERVRKLKEKQKHHLRKLLSAGFGAEYALEALSSGVVHEREGVSPSDYAGAFAKWSELILKVLREKFEPSLHWELAVALQKAVLFDLVLSLDAYYWAKALRMSDERSRALLDSAPTGIVIADPASGRIVQVNRKLLELMGRKEEELLGAEVFNLFSEGHDILLRRNLKDYIEGKKNPPEVLYLRAEPEPIPVELLVSVYRDGEKLFAILSMRDLREKLRREEERRRTARLYEALSGINILVTTAGDEETLFKSAVEIITSKGGFKYAGIFRKDGGVVAQLGDYSPQDISLCISINDSLFLLISRFSSEAFLKDEVELLLEIAHDLSFGLEKMRSKEETKRLLLYDSLTGLPNRSYFLQRLKEMVEDARTKGRQIGLVIMDIDNFKELNEAFGHVAGDHILRETASRIRSVVRENDFLARIGDDEFGVILSSHKAREAVDKLVGRIKEKFSAPIEVKGQRIFITFSMGVSIYPEDVSGAELLYSNAASSVERAKSLGGNRHVFFSEHVSGAGERVILRSALRNAIDREEFILYYQPKVDLKTGRVIGAEALLRWLRDGEIVPPGKFIPLLEEGVLIHDIGRWVFEEACRQIEVWAQEGISLPIAVNLSPTQFKAPEFYEEFTSVLSGCGEAKENIEIEITESAVMEDPARSIEILEKLSSEGIPIYIDDFGTGYSSLAYLKKLPAEGLKIDIEFIRELPEDREDLEIVKAVILLAKTFGLKTVAEGVEKGEQAVLLRELGCDYAQGCYFAKPMPAEEFLSYVKNTEKNL